MSALPKNLTVSRIRVASVAHVSYLGQISQKKLAAYITGVLLTIGIANQQSANAATYESFKNLPSQTAANPGAISQYLKKTSKASQLPANGETVAPKEGGYVVYVLETKAQKAASDASYFYPLYLD